MPYKLSDSIVSEALNRTNSWPVTKWLCEHQNPDQPSIERILILAGANNQETLVKIILERFQPGLESTEKASTLAVTRKNNWIVDFSSLAIYP